VIDISQAQMPIYKCFNPVDDNDDDDDDMEYIENK